MLLTMPPVGLRSRASLHVARSALSPSLETQQWRCTAQTVARGARSYAASSAAARPTDMPVSQSSQTDPSSSKLKLKRTYGQPLPHTHPHLFQRSLHPPEGSTSGLAVGDLTPGIPASEYEERRRKLMDRLPEGSVVVALAGRMKSMSGNIFYKFRQESNFWYLTGFQEPDAALILEKNSSSRGYKMTMFVQPRDDHNETWNGPRTGLDGAVDIFGADESYATDPAALLAHLKQVLPRFNHVYVEPPATPTVPRTPSRSVRRNIINFLSPTSPNGMDLFAKKIDFDAVVTLLGDPRRCHSLAREIEPLRVRKSANELRVMKRAGDVSSEAMAQTMKFCEPGRTEAQLQATFEYHCGLQGSQRPAYVPVVASGANALTIHYINNDHVLRDGDLVCIDAGCELDGYASDITRAFPINGQFTGPQRDLYSAVLRVLRSCTTLATASQRYTLSELHRRSVEMLRVELKDLGFNLGAGVLERTLYPHYLGHWLGIDLHDTNGVDRSQTLEEGMVVTIEPGLYIPISDEFPKHFQGLGIRIEDDIAVREYDNIILSANAPKEVVDVEATCQRFLEGQGQGLDPKEKGTPLSAFAYA